MFAQRKLEASLIHNKTRQVGKDKEDLLCFREIKTSALF